jgi:hypothetical protein
MDVSTLTIDELTLLLSFVRSEAVTEQVSFDENDIRLQALGYALSVDPDPQSFDTTAEGVARLVIDTFEETNAQARHIQSLVDALGGTVASVRSSLRQHYLLNSDFRQVYGAYLFSSVTRLNTVGKRLFERAGLSPVVYTLDALDERCLGMFPRQ